MFDLAYAALGREPGANTLIEELTRAQVGIDAPPEVVRMEDSVIFTYDGSSYRDFALVFPSEADISARRISVLTQVGAMLLGLRPGQSIAQNGPDGPGHGLMIESVSR